MGRSEFVKDKLSLSVKYAAFLLPVAWAGLGAADNGANGSGRCDAGSSFAPPSAEQLSKITHPALRVELMRMAGEDQAARSAAT